MLTFAHHSCHGCETVVQVVLKLGEVIRGYEQRCINSTDSTYVL